MPRGREADAFGGELRQEHPAVRDSTEALEPNDALGLQTARPRAELTQPRLLLARLVALALQQWARGSGQPTNQCVELAQPLLVLEDGAELCQPHADLREINSRSMNRKELLRVIEISRPGRHQLVEHEILHVRHAHLEPVDRYQRAAVERLGLEG